MLLNEDSSLGGFTDWEITRAIKGTSPSLTPTSFSTYIRPPAYIEPITTALEPFHKFTIESQILHHAPVKFTPELRADAEEREWWSVSQVQAGVFVNTEQWTLGT